VPFRSTNLGLFQQPARGIAQVRLSTLPPDLQTRFGYDPVRSAEYDREIAAVEEAQRQAALLRQAQAKEAKRIEREKGPWTRVQERFGTSADLKGADLRTDFISLDLGVKNQGARPSCAVFAVLGALEYEYARRRGPATRFSEDYLIWATRRTSGRQALPGAAQLNNQERAFLDALLDDIGFTLDEVLTTLRVYGASTSDEMPNGVGPRMSKIPEPPSYVVESAKSRRCVSSEELPGFMPAVRVENVIHALNEGIPVIIGFPWPRLGTLAESNIRATDLPSSYRHAVTLVGYTVVGGDHSSVRFIFRNSWGRK
jgi:hypothetical protein